MGADSAGSDGHVIYSREDPKVFKIGPFMIGGCGSFRMLQLLMYDDYFGENKIQLSKLRPPPKNKDVHKFLVTKFIPVIRAVFKKGGIAGNKEEDDSFNGAFLIAIRDCLFNIEADFQVGVYDKYVATGSGHDFCMGALEVCWQSGFPPDEAIEMALDSAAKYCTSVQGPNLIINNKKNV